MSTRKYISFFIVLLALLSSVFSPFFTERALAFAAPGATGLITGASLRPHVPTGDTVGDLVTTTLKLAAKEIAQQMIEQMVKDTVNWINTGFNGNPAYVTNPEKYFADIANGVAEDFISDSSIGLLCSASGMQNTIQSQVKDALKFTYDTVYAQVKPTYACTLTSVWRNIKSLQDYQNNFAGGWSTWFQITQNDAENPYGATLAALQAQSQAVQTKVDTANKEYNINKGFLSFKDDKTGNILTPGTVIESQLNSTLGSGFSQLVNAKDFDDLIDAFTSLLLKKTVFPARNTGLFSSKSVDYANTQTPTSENPISCTADTQNAVVGDKVTWTASASLPSTTIVEYIWNGDEVTNQPDKTGSLVVTYANDGKKTMGVVASTSDITIDPDTGAETLTNHKLIPSDGTNVPCTGSVLVAKYPPLKVLDCRPSSLTTQVNTPVTWTATISGGSGTLTGVTWSGGQSSIPGSSGEGADIWSHVTTYTDVKNPDGTVTLTATRVYYGNNGSHVGAQPGDIEDASLEVFDKDQNVLPIQNASCGSITISP